MVGAVGAVAAERLNQESSVPVKPGGVWISPENGQRTSGTVHLEAQAYPTRPKDPAIDYVNFTAQVNGTWQTVCRVTPPPPTAIPEFGCDWTPPKTLESNTQVVVSFDVYDREKNVNKQPHGPRTIFVSP